MLSQPAHAENILRLVRRIRHVFVIAPTQFIHQMPEMGRGRAETQVLLQPLADGIADRSAGLAIDLFALVGDSAVHGEVPLRGHFIVVMQDQVSGLEIVSSGRTIACILVKIE
jgi:hypothetical protein